MHADFKVTTWERVYFPDDMKQEDQDEALRKIKEDIITTSNDLIEEIVQLDLHAECETLYEVEEQLTVEENGGCPTIEVFSERAEVIPILTNAN